MDKTVLISGGSGFLGINMVRHLLGQGGMKVRVLDIADFDYPEADRIGFIKGDIRDRETVARAMEGVQWVIHTAAALPLYKPADIFSTEVEGTRILLEAAHTAAVERLVHISSTAVYGIPDHHPLLEDDKLDGVGPYGQAKIDAEAAALGFKKVGKTYDTNAQQAATLSLIYKQTTDAQGNFARETDTTAHKQQVLAARFDNLKAKVGKGLLPVYNTLLDFTEKRMGPAFRAVTKAVQPVIAAIGDRLGPVIERVTGFMRENPAVVKAFAITLGILAGAIGLVTLATTAFSIALNSTGIPLVIIAIAALVAGLVYAYQHSEQFRVIVDKVGQLLRGFGAFVRDEIVPVVIDLAQKVAQHLQPAWAALVEFFTASVLPVVQQVLAKLQEWQPTIQRVIAVIAGLVAKWLEFYAMVYGKVIPVVLKVAGFLLRNLWPALAGGAVVIGMIINRLIAFGKKVWDAGTAVGEFARKVGDRIGKVLKWIGELPGKALAALGNVGELLYGTGKDIIQGLWNGLRKKWDEVKGWLSDRANDIQNALKKPLKIMSPSRVMMRIGGFIMAGLRNGLRNGFGGVDEVLGKIGDKVANFIDKNKVGKKLGKRAQAVIAQITAVAQGLRDALSARDDAASSVASGFSGEFNLSEIFGKNEFGISLGANSAVRAAQSIVARIRAFAGQLTQLVAAGMPGALVREVASLGSAEGKRVADVLLRGGAGAVSQISGAYNDFQAIAQSAGMTVANASYGVDIERAEAVFAAAIERGLAKMGIEVQAQIGVTNDAAVSIVNKGEKRKKKRR